MEELGKTYKKNNLLIFIILIVILFIIIIYWNKIKINNKENKEDMSGGTLTQLFAQDSQDVYLKSNVDKTATGNFNLYWNQPTKIANTFMNRGTPLPSIYLPNTQMNPTSNLEISSNNYTDYILEKSKYEKSFPNPLVSVDLKDNNLNYQLVLPKKNGNKKLLNLNELKSNEQQESIKEFKPRDYLYQIYYDKLLYEKDCVKDPASCGGGSGGFRLGEDFIQSTKTKSYISIDGNIYYPDSYTGSYFIEPNFDISKPYPYIPDSNLPPNPIKIG